MRSETLKSKTDQNILAHEINAKENTKNMNWPGVLEIISFYFLL